MSSEKGGSIPGDVARQLVAAGHSAESFSGCTMLPLSTVRGITSKQRDALTGRIVRVLPPGASAKKAVVRCLQCPWCSHCTGVLRALDHCVHQSNPTVQCVEKHLRALGLTFTETKRRALDGYRNTGNRVSMCTGGPLDRQVSLELAKEGLESAKLWRTLLNPDSVNDELATATRAEEAPPVASIERLHRLHAFQMFMTHVPFQSVEHPAVVNFFRELAPAYAPPKRKRVRQLLDSACVEITAALETEIGKAGPWCLQTDGATIDSFGWLNIVAVNPYGKVLLLDHISLVGVDSSAENFANLLRPWLSRHTVGCVADNAANVQSMARKLRDSHDGPFLPLRCQEHGAQLLLGDLRDALPYLQKATQEAHACVKFVRSQKKLDGRMKAAGLVLQHRRKTRHNSWTNMVVRFLQHKHKVRDHMRAVGVDNIGRTAKQRARAQKAIGALERKALHARLRKGLPLLWLTTSLSQSLAAARLPEALHVWTLYTKTVKKAAKDADFKDTLVGETDGDVRERSVAIEKIVKDRRDMFCDDVVTGAAALDPRLSAPGVEDADGLRHLSFVTCRRKLLPMFFPAGETLAEAQHHLAHFQDHSGIFESIPWVLPEAPLKEVLDWWARVQPSGLLCRLAMALFACPCSQGQCERQWAFANRDQVPIRCRLGLDTFTKLQTVHANMRLLEPTVSSKEPEALKKCMALKNFPPTPCTDAAVDPVAFDLCAEDDTLSMCSSSSTTSDTEG